jgi:hypothetical protein
MSASNGMWVGVLRLDLAIPGARSLKDRRQVVKSLKERLISRFGVACAEVGDRESWVRASLGVAVCSVDRAHVQELLDNVARYAQNDAGAAVGNVDRDIFQYGGDE